ncbi:coiled-coil domain-containing protein 74A-like isoform X2 [Sinocyclocheilus grahami]|uniref:coiled-coil domain-containing protein 74A-like isoform X2 n=1 Tax=Sinocyclocheilus grahami TaxID=75366 RepID=UPI0007AD66C1|nr:PREDICTED: coiled-coil domain-containing protein 74A-like isoform X2 [Sinocyclocheilus grahami]
MFSDCSIIHINGLRLIECSVNIVGEVMDDGKPAGVSIMEMSTMSTSNLPPLRNLPSWTRVRDLDRVRYPRHLSSDCMVRSPPVDIKSPKAAAQPRTDAQGTHIASLEKDVLFLQQQHKDTLERLHAEIEDLKRVNKELQYQLIMEHENSPKESIWSNSNSSKSSSDGSAEKNSQCGFISSEEACEAEGGGAVTSLLPLRITCSPSQQPRTPTLKECELIIRQLYHANTAQYQELLRIKTVFREITSKNRSAAEAFSLARASLRDNSRGEVFEHFPKLPLKPLSKKEIPSHAGKGEHVLLPAIKHGLSSTMSERQRRAQDVHRLRLRRAVNS